jgi:SAM-dependent methyltransferase
MVIVTQPDRVLLGYEVGRYAPKLTGALLDIGSGRSRRYGALFSHVASYTTLDRDTDWKPDLVGSAEKIPLPDESIDSILCTQVLEHVPHPQVAIAEMFRVLKKGGRCLLTVPQENELHEEPHDYFRYTNYGLRVLFEEAGFTIEAMDQRGGYHAMMMQIRIRHLVNTWKPYERKLAMWILAPLTLLLTNYALARDRACRNPAAKLHTIGWCVLARKPL